MDLSPSCSLSTTPRSFVVRILIDRGGPRLAIRPLSFGESKSSIYAKSLSMPRDGIARCVPKMVIIQNFRETASFIGSRCEKMPTAANALPAESVKTAQHSWQVPSGFS